MIRTEIKELEDRIKDHLYNEYKAAEIRSKCEIMNHNESPSSKFLRVEATTAKKMLIKSLRTENGNITCNTKETIKVAEQFYSHLYENEDLENVVETQEFTSNLPSSNYCARY